MKSLRASAILVLIGVLFVSSAFAQAKVMGDPNCMLMRIPVNTFNSAPEVDYEPFVFDGLINHVTKLKGVKKIRSTENISWHDSDALSKFIYSSTYDSSGRVESDTTILYEGKKKNYDTSTFSFNSYVYDFAHKIMTWKGVSLNKDDYSRSSYSDFDTTYYNGFNKIDSIKVKAVKPDGTESANTTIIKYDSSNRTFLKTTQYVRKESQSKKAFTDKWRVNDKYTYSRDTSSFFNTKALAFIFPDTVYYADLLRRARKCKAEKILVLDSVSKTVRHIIKTPTFSIECWQSQRSWEGEHPDYELESRGVTFSPNLQSWMVIINYDDKGNTYCRLETLIYDDGRSSFRDAHMTLLDYRNYVFQTKYKYTFTDNEGRVSTKTYKYPIKLRHGLVKEYTQHYASGNVIDFFKKPDRAINRAVFQYIF